MPIGLLTDCFSVLLGGLAGAVIQSRLSTRICKNITIVLGCMAMAIGISSIAQVNAMPPVAVAVVLGTFIGEAINLEKHLSTTFAAIIKKAAPNNTTLDLHQFVTVFIVFCASGFGIYGVLMEGMAGTSHILLSKSVMDFCTAIVFSATLGPLVTAIALPMLIIMGFFYTIAGFLAPLVSPAMLQNFVACGGVLTLAAGLRVAGIKNTPIANMVPALVLILPLSALWEMLPL
ncbi:MAG: DUF554 domain-containing protein [Oscillospiraceae bacterium]